MNAIDATEHYDKAAEAQPASLVVVILDTNPHAWSLHAPALSLSKALAEILVFINAHLAFNQANRIAVIASHCQRTAWLYPTPNPGPRTLDDHGQNPAERSNGHAPTDGVTANKYRPFALVETEVIGNLRQLLGTTTPEELASTSTTMIAGALTLALSYINRITLSLAPAGVSGSTNIISTGADVMGATSQQNMSSLTSRILIVSTSGDLASQYIPLMNLTFAAQHARIPIDILKLAGDTVLLQQASYTTSGIFLTPTANQPSANSPISLLPTLLFAYLPDATARAHLILPTSSHIDFRAACFCHRRVVDLGFVCSICLSIFCADALPLPDSRCLTCGTKLRVNTGPSKLQLPDEEKASNTRKKKRRKNVDEIGTPIPVD